MNRICIKVQKYTHAHNKKITFLTIGGYEQQHEFMLGARLQE